MSLINCPSDGDNCLRSLRANPGVEFHSVFLASWSLLRSVFIPASQSQPGQCISLYRIEFVNSPLHHARIQTIEHYYNVARVYTASEDELKDTIHFKDRCKVYPLNCWDKCEKRDLFRIAGRSFSEHFPFVIIYSAHSSQLKFEGHSCVKKLFLNMW